MTRLGTIAFIVAGAAFGLMWAVYLGLPTWLIVAATLAGGATAGLIGYSWEAR